MVYGLKIIIGYKIQMGEEKVVSYASSKNIILLIQKKFQLFQFYKIYKSYIAYHFQN